MIKISKFEEHTIDELEATLNAFIGSLDDFDIEVVGINITETVYNYVAFITYSIEKDDEDIAKLRKSIADGLNG